MSSIGVFSVSAARKIWQNTNIIVPADRNRVVENSTSLLFGQQVTDWFRHGTVWCCVCSIWNDPAVTRGSLTPILTKNEVFCVSGIESRNFIRDPSYSDGKPPTLPDDVVVLRPDNDGMYGIVSHERHIIAGKVTSEIKAGDGGVIEVWFSIRAGEEKPKDHKANAIPRAYPVMVGSQVAQFMTIKQSGNREPVASKELTSATQPISRPVRATFNEGDKKIDVGKRVAASWYEDHWEVTTEFCVETA